MRGANPSFQSPAVTRVLSLQRSIGNRATSRLLARRVLSVNSPPAPGPFYSTETERYYATEQDALDAERALFEQGQMDYRNLMTADFSDETGDEDWDPQTKVRNRLEAEAASSGNTDLERYTHQWSGKFERFESGFGTASVRTGRGQQPFVQSRKSDFNDVQVGLDYDVICAILDNRSEGERETLADHILMAMEGRDVSKLLGRYDDETRRAAAHLISITQVAEQHSSRTLGSAAMARALLIAIRDGTMTFAQAFRRSGGRYVPAHIGGTQEARGIRTGTTPVDVSLTLMDTT